MRDRPADRAGRRSTLPTVDLITLLALAALWGASFLFMRLAAPDFGVVPLVAVRVSLASVVLLPLLLWQGHGAWLRTHAAPLTAVGVLNSAIPFLGFAWAALSITAGLSSVFNATTPLWGALIGWLWLGQRPGAAGTVGLLMGLAGVVLLAGDTLGLRAGASDGAAAGAIVACLGATACYGVAAHLARQKLAGVPPLATATGSQLAAAGVLAVPGVLLWPAQAPSMQAWAAAIGLAVPCTALAYLLFFRLIARIGASRAITVTFLIPLFGTGWGALWLDETVTVAMAVAGAVILLGTALASGAVAWPRGSPSPSPSPSQSARDPAADR